MGYFAVCGRSEMIHIDSRRLYAISQLDRCEFSSQLTEEEKNHLQQCEECQRILAIFAREFDAESPPHDAA